MGDGHNPVLKKILPKAWKIFCCRLRKEMYKILMIQLKIQDQINRQLYENRIKNINDKYWKEYYEIRINMTRARIDQIFNALRSLPVINYTEKSVMCQLHTTHERKICMMMLKSGKKVFNTKYYDPYDAEQRVCNEDHMYAQSKVPEYLQEIYD
jgi:hypothetical protein